MSTVTNEETSHCPFCDLGDREVMSANEHALAVADGYPVAPGHTLVIPRRHLVSVFDATAEEQQAVWQLVGLVRQNLLEMYTPDGFTIGINDGRAAGQTVMHGHVHVIPRHAGDVEDPRGGVRHVIAAKACYWKSP